MEQRRSRISAIGINVALFALGAAVPFVLPPRTEKEPPTKTPEVAPVANEPPEAVEGEETRTPEEHFEGTLEKLLSSVTPAGKTGAIAGSVIARDGSPVPGAEIAIGAQVSSADAHEWTENPPLEEILLERVRARSLSRTAVTGGDGTFQVDGLREDREYSVRVSHPRYTISAAEGTNAKRVTTGQVVEFLAEPRNLFPVRVAIVLPDGSFPPQARLEARCIGGSTSGGRETWTPEDPILWSPCETVSLSAYYSQEPLEYVADPVEVRAANRDQPTLVTLRLKSVPGVKGKILFPQGQVPSGSSHVRVVALRLQEPVRPPARILWQSRIENYIGTPSQRDCPYAFRNLPPGLYGVYASFSASLDEVIAEAYVEVSDRMVVQDLIVEPIPPSQSVRVWVYCPTGILWVNRSMTVHPDVSIWIVRADAPGFFICSVFQEDAGCFFVPIPDGIEESPDASWVLRVDSAQYGVREVPFDPRRDRELRVEFSEPAVVVAQVEDTVGNEYWGEPVCLELVAPGLELARSEPKPMRFSDHDLDEWGRAVFVATPGDYELGLRWVWKGTELARIPVRLSPGINEVTLKPAPLFDVVVRLPSGNKESDFCLLSPEGTVERVSGGDLEGRIVLRRLRQGSYVLQSDTGESVRFSLPGPTEIDFSRQVREFVFLEARLNDPAGYLAQLGLRSGDIVVAIDGRELKTAEDVHSALGAAFGKSAVELQVFRGEESFSVSADPGRLLRPELLGGRLVLGRR